MQKNNYSNTQTLAIMGLLIALNVVLSRFLSINTQIVKIGFTFVTLFMAGHLFGPVKGAIVGGLGDFIGAILLPFASYFFGFTLTAMICGFVWGLFTHKQASFTKILIAISINQLICSLIINTYWIHYLYGSPFNILLTARISQTLILIPIEITICYAFSKFTHLVKKV